MEEFRRGCINDFIKNDLCHVVDGYQRTYDISYTKNFLASFPFEFIPYKDSIKTHKKASAVLRHDVDHSLRNALAMAKIEHDLGIRSSYFLLHPDGLVNRKNYFGQIVNNKMEIFPWLL